MLLERLAGSILGLVAFSIITLPYYAVSSKHLDEYPLPASIGLSVSFTIFIAYILQYFSLRLFPVAVLGTYIVAYRYGTFDLEYDRTISTLFLLGFAVRWIPNFFTGKVPNYLVPAGADQQHHLYLTRLISESATIPETWQAGFNHPLYYNPGFALLGASVDQLPLTDPLGILYSIPFMMSTGFGVLMYAVTKELRFKRKYAVFSSVVILFGSYSMFVVHSFGGYAQLASMVAMATSLLFFLRYRKERTRLNLVCLITGLAAMGLSHYYVAVFMGIFYGLYMLKNLEYQAFLDITIPGAISVLITSPWFLRVYRTVPESTGSAILNFNSLSPGFDPLHLVFLSLGPFSVMLSFFYLKKSQLDVYAVWGSIVLVLSQTAAFGFYILIGSRWWHGAVLPLGVLAASGAKNIYEKYLEDFITFKTFLRLFLVVNLLGVSMMYNYRYTTHRDSTTLQDYQTFEYVEEELPEDTLIHPVGREARWVLPVSYRNLTDPFIPVAPKNLVERMKRYQELYREGKWERMSSKGVDYYLIPEKKEVPPGCLKVHKSLYTCG